MNPARTQPGARTGLSLIEVMLAVTIVSMTLTGLVTAAAQSLRIAERARQFETARLLFNTLQLEEPLQLDELEEGSDSGSFKSPYSSYGWKRDIKLAGLEEDEIYEIHTRIEWDTRKGRAGESLYTLLHLPSARRSGWIKEAP